MLRRVDQVGVERHKGKRLSADGSAAERRGGQAGLAVERRRGWGRGDARHCRYDSLTAVAAGIGARLSSADPTHSYLIINGQLMPQVVLSFAKLAGHAAEELPHWTLDRDVWILVFMVLLGACSGEPATSSR